MCHHNDRHTLFFGDVSEHRPDHRARCGVEIACGFICKDDRGFVEQRPRDRDALLLAARERFGAMGGSIFKPEQVEEFVGPCDEFFGLIAREQPRKLDIFECGHRWNEIECLKNNPDVLSAEHRRLGFAHRVDRMTRNNNLAFVWTVHRREHVQEGGLARTRSPHDGIEPRRFNREINTPQCVDSARADGE